VWAWEYYLTAEYAEVAEKINSSTQRSLRTDTECAEKSNGFTTESTENTERT
jgi:hypothetical protein